MEAICLVSSFQTVNSNCHKLKSIAHTFNTDKNNNNKTVYAIYYFYVNKTEDILQFYHQHVINYLSFFFVTYF